MSTLYRFYRGTPLIKTYVTTWGRPGTPDYHEVTLTGTSEETEREALRIGRENGWGMPTSSGLAR